MDKLVDMAYNGYNKTKEADMKKYLIRIETNRSAEAVYINGDSLRPFQIAHNLWNYTTPWTAAQRLEKLAKAWEDNGFSVRRVYGMVEEMPTSGNEFNLAMIKNEWCGR